MPELKAINRSALPIVLLDGEELAGAKQNRALNTTILLPPLSATVIPVSCTEAGRWSYTSSTFRASGNITPRALRSTSQAAVGRSLAAGRTFHSDQGAVWNTIDTLRSAAAASAPTRALSDVYTARRADLADYMQAFSVVAGQVGFVALINGRVTGCDWLSLSAAYSDLHAKLVASYALDALLMQHAATRLPERAAAEAFLTAAAGCSATTYPSAGLGSDIRYAGAGIAGSALEYKAATIHCALFAAAAAPGAGAGMASARRRRGFRTML